MHRESTSAPESPSFPAATIAGIAGSVNIAWNVVTLSYGGRVAYVYLCMLLLVCVYVYVCIYVCVYLLMYVFMYQGC